MKANSVFRTEEGKAKVLGRYDEILSMFPLGKRYVDTSYGKTFILEAGDPSNSPVILLHGSCSNSVFWMGEIPALSEKYHVCAVDIIGEAGNSADNRHDIGADDYALWLGEVLDALGFGKASLIGNSLGGWLALKFAVKYPHRVEKLVLLASPGIAPVRPSFYAQTAAVEQGSAGASVLHETVLGENQIPQAVLDFMNLILENFLPITDSLPPYNDEQLKALTMPVLFIAGDQDVIVDAEGSAERLKTLLPEAEIHVLKDCTHYIPQAIGIILPFMSKGV